MGISKENELKADGLKALWILEENDNKKKLQFEASPRVVHKRSTSQNIPIWQHKRSSSVILSEIGRLKKRMLVELINIGW